MDDECFKSEKIENTLFFKNMMLMVEFVEVEMNFAYPELITWLFGD